MMRTIWLGIALAPLVVAGSSGCSKSPSENPPAASPAQRTRSPEQAKEIVSAAKPAATFPATEPAGLSGESPPRGAERTVPTTPEQRSQPERVAKVEPVTPKPPPKPAEPPKPREPPPPPVTVPITPESAVKDIQRHGGRLVYAANRRDVKRLEFDDSGLTDDELAWLKAFPQLESLVLINEPRITDAGLTNLASLKNLQVLILNYTRISNAGLAYIKPLTTLRSLTLAGSRVNDDGLKELAGLSNLERIDLEGTNVTSKGVAALQKALPKARILD